MLLTSESFTTQAEIEARMQMATTGKTQLEAMTWRYGWLKQARPTQKPPRNPNWDLWLLIAGRGFGKTRTGAETLAGLAWDNPKTRWAVVAPTAADVRDTCFEGVSGLLACIPEKLVLNYNRSLSELILINGSIIKGFSADSPERLRGPQHHGAWCDEVGSWRYEDAWDQLMFGLRLGSCPKTIVTTTPRPTTLVKKLMSRKNVYITTGSTFDNAANLAAPALKLLKERYEGTRLGRQELYAQLLLDVPGALWTLGQLEQCRATVVPVLRRIVVGVDPAVTATSASNSTGIVVAGLGDDKKGYVLADYTLVGSPDTWAKQVVRAYELHDADCVVAEVNQGGDLVSSVLKTVSPNMKVKQVRATKGKILRAEPIAGLYEQGKVFHVGHFKQLEDQMTNFSPLTQNSSPDRLDALVWALTDLMLKNTALPSVGLQGLGGSNRFAVLNGR